MRLAPHTLAVIGLAAAASAVMAAPKFKGPKEGKGHKSGVVTTSGTEFMLDGKKFDFAGANAYWMAQLPEQSSIDATFSSMASFGIKVLRTWAFSMVTNTSSAAPGLVYYQNWNNGNQWTLNTGSNGISQLDAVVQSAEAHGIKLILTLTNNWNDYGGMDMYLEQITGNNTYHDHFYTNSDVIQSYQRYVSTIVNRYKDSNAVFAWELANEPRTNGYPSIASSSDSATLVSELTSWIKQQSAFIKSIDPVHMVCIGDEGYFYNGPGPSTDYIYNGGSGLDFVGNLQLPDIDFGTFHLYPQGWGESNPSYIDWGSDYISQHADAMNQVGKPVILEEFGLTVNKSEAYPQWFAAANSGSLPGVMPWQWGQMDLPAGQGPVNGTGFSPDDGYTIYPSMTDVYNEFKQEADTLNGKK